MNYEQSKREYNVLLNHVMCSELLNRRQNIMQYIDEKLREAGCEILGKTNPALLAILESLQAVCSDEEGSLSRVTEETEGILRKLREEGDTQFLFERRESLARIDELCGVLRR